MDARGWNKAVDLEYVVTLAPIRANSMDCVSRCYGSRVRSGSRGDFHRCETREIAFFLESVL